MVKVVSKNKRARRVHRYSEKTHLSMELCSRWRLEGIRSVDTQPVVIHNDISIHNVPGDVALSWFYRLSTRCSSDIPPSRIWCFRKNQPGSHRVFSVTPSRQMRAWQSWVIDSALFLEPRLVFLWDTHVIQVGLAPQFGGGKNASNAEWFILLLIFPGFLMCQADHMNVTMCCHSDGTVMVIIVMLY